MSFYENISVGIVCDGEDCSESINHDWRLSDDGLRMEAEDEGWWTSRDVAYCPKCRGKYGHEEEEE